jgi:membrane fusion protein, multidrug efflux system
VTRFTALRAAQLFWLLLPLSAPGQPAPAGSAPGQPLAGVIVREAVVKPFPLAAEALGNARANEDVEIRPEITAAVVEILFEEGQAVAQGTVLLRLESSEPLAQLAAARAALIDSESQYRRASELYKTRVVAESQLEQLEAWITP